MSSTSERSSGLELSGAQVCHSRSISLAIGVARIDRAGDAYGNIVVAIERLFEATEFNAVVAAVPGALAILAVDRMAILERCLEHALVFFGKSVENDGS